MKTSGHPQGPGEWRKTDSEPGANVGTSLFRPEAVQARTSQHLGSIRIGTRPRHRLAAVVALALGAALLALAGFGEVTRKASVAGFLVPELGALELSASVAGTLGERLVPEGAQVQAGERLFVVDTDRAAENGLVFESVSRSMQQRMSALRRERALRALQAKLRRQALDERSRSLARERDQALSEGNLIERREALASQGLQRYRRLVDSGFVAPTLADDRQEALLDVQGRAAAQARALMQIERELAAVASERRAVDAQEATDLSTVDRMLSQLDQDRTENDARRRQAVIAPAAGMLSTWHLPVGATLQPGQTVATLVVGGTGAASMDGQRRARLQAELYASSRTAGFVRKGQSVWLRLDAYPYQKFGMAQGRVTRVSRTPVNPRDLPAGQAPALMAAARANEPLFRIGVELAAQQIEAYGQLQALKPGMALTADIVQARLNFWEWLLEPLLAAKKKLEIGT